MKVAVKRAFVSVFFPPAIKIYAIENEVLILILYYSFIEIISGIYSQILLQKSVENEARIYSAEGSNAKTEFEDNCQREVNPHSKDKTSSKRIDGWTNDPLQNSVKKKKNISYCIEHHLSFFFLHYRIPFRR